MKVEHVTAVMAYAMTSFFYLSSLYAVVLVYDVSETLAVVAFTAALLHVPVIVFGIVWYKEST